MNKLKLSKWSIIALVIAMCALVVAFFAPIEKESLIFAFDAKLNVDDAFQLYNSDDKELFDENKSCIAKAEAGEDEPIQLSFPVKASYIRLDIGSENSEVVLSDFKYICRDAETAISIETFFAEAITNDIESCKFEDDKLIVSCNGEDPYIIVPVSKTEVSEIVSDYFKIYNFILKILVCLFLLLVLRTILRHIKDYYEFPKEIWQSRKLIVQLSKNDFKTKFAGSYLGIIWAFIQPVITVLVYWFVFQKGLRSGAVSDVPFVLWLIAGLVPWFFFSDALSGGTNALLEYQYLVKKVVFQINILPVVKVLAALYVHVFFVVFSIVLYACYGYFPDLYYLQLIYYSFCMFIMVLGICYFTSAVVGFFRDLSQIILIILQVGVWMTPIMWDINSMGLPGWLKKIFELNPMYYIVNGYRDSLIYKVGFWQHPNLTIYFWIATLFFFAMGTLVFKKLKIHFADVL